MPARPSRADVLDDILGELAPPPRRAESPLSLAGKPGDPGEAQQPPQSEQPGKPQGLKARLNVELPAELMAQTRDAVIALSGPPLRLTIAGLVAEALRHELARLQAEHNRGHPFPPTDRLVRVGRPIGS
jgi:hypothetical protein